MEMRNMKAKFLAAKVVEKEAGKTAICLQFKAFDTEAAIYRMEVFGFIFDFHYEEYFDDFSVKDAKLIWKGTISKGEGNWCTYEDDDIEVQKIYMYWVATASEPEKVTGPVLIKVRDRAAWWNYEKVLQETYRMEKEFTNVRAILSGETVQHRPLVALLAGNTDKVVALVGAVHATEGGPEVALGVVRNILEQRPELLEKVGLAVLPSVNADAREEIVNGTPWYIRKNPNGVDLNRNFDADWEEISTMYGCRSDEQKAPTYRGVRPASEPETQAVVRFLDIVKPLICFSEHAMSSIPGDVLLYPKMAQEDETYLRRAEKIAGAYKEGYRRELNWEIKSVMVSGCSTGSLPAYAYKKGIISFDMEHAHGRVGNVFDDSKRDMTTRELLELCVRCHTNGMIALLEYLAQQEA